MSGGEQHHYRQHQPVMCCEVLELLQPKAGGLYIDGTFGAGGHARAILASAPCSVIGIDRDPTAHALADEIPPALTLLQGRFGEMETLLAGQDVKSVDGILLDLGVSSGQLDDAARGFSFREDAPLDMRMGGEGRTAANWLATLSETELTRILRTYGDIKMAGRLARALIAAQKQHAFTRTGELARFAEQHLYRHGKVHPATRLFQALRILVNNEIGELSLGLAAAERLLREGGRLVVISFHSLEDRLVKQFIAARAPMKGAGVNRHAPPPAPALPPSFVPLLSRARKPSAEEIATNPRARSARLRAAERTAHPAHQRVIVPPMLANLPGMISC